MYGHKHLFQTLPRLLTVYFEHCDTLPSEQQWHPSRAAMSSSSSTSGRRGGSRDAQKNKRIDNDNTAELSMSLPYWSHWFLLVINFTNILVNRHSNTMAMNVLCNRKNWPFYFQHFSG
jgi:hypothetical protein